MTKPGVPPSYDAIVHETVPTWDLFRPTTPPTSVPERELEARVRAALHADATLTQQLKIDVLVHGSHVWLTGKAIGPGQAAYAADLARRVPGVTEVHNELAIVPGL
ncbi:MAG: BON domain-containing protein [Proteobacteria bacterium]|nr:BON domain-containing protein [Pseudomonadota bacterium]